MGNKVLVVDDDAAVRVPIGAYLERSGYKVFEASSVSSGRATFRRELPDAVLLDHALPDGTSLDLLPRFRSLRPQVPIAILTGFGSIDLAVHATKAGADDLFTKPVDMPALVDWLNRRMATTLRPKDDAPQALDPFIGDSDAIIALEQEARIAIAAPSPVLIVGPTGSGKGVLARFLHEAGPRHAAPFVALNCGALSRELLQSELFGHAKGAFTGAIRDKEGLFEIADGGTLFLDEIGDLDAHVQPELLTVLEERAFRRVGGLRRREVDVRFISATHRDLPHGSPGTQFRADLYYRVSTLTLRVPALRDRRQDIPDLAEALSSRLAGDLGVPTPTISAGAMANLVSYDWPGNIRELRNVLERGLAGADGTTLHRRHLRFDGQVSGVARSGNLTAPGQGSLAELEREYIERILRQERGNVVRTAARLGLPRSTLYARLRSFDIRPDDYR